LNSITFKKDLKIDMKKVAIVSAYRSAIGSFGGSLKDIKIADLGSHVLTYALRKASISPNLVEEVILGNV
ncbi:acetyl-CoA C-acyltransferase, partial [Listeria monocytogenes]